MPACHGLLTGDGSAELNAEGEEGHKEVVTLRFIRLEDRHVDVAVADVAATGNE